MQFVRNTQIEILDMKATAFKMKNTSMEIKVD